jgi:hypothetical protein
VQGDGQGLAFLFAGVDEADGRGLQLVGQVGDELLAALARGEHVVQAPGEVGQFGGTGHRGPGGGFGLGLADRH